MIKISNCFNKIRLKSETRPQNEPHNDRAGLFGRDGYVGGVLGVVLNSNVSGNEQQLSTI